MPANLKRNPKAASQTFILDCTKPVDDGLMEAASFVRGHAHTCFAARTREDRRGDSGGWG